MVTLWFKIGKYGNESIEYHKNLTGFNLKMQIKSANGSIYKITSFSKVIFLQVGETTLSWKYLHTVGKYLNWYKFYRKQFDSFYQEL